MTAPCAYEDIDYETWDPRDWFDRTTSTYILPDEAIMANWSESKKRKFRDKIKGTWHKWFGAHETDQEADEAAYGAGTTWNSAKNEESEDEEVERSDGPRPKSKVKARPPSKAPKNPSQAALEDARATMEEMKSQARPVDKATSSAEPSQWSEGAAPPAKRTRVAKTHNVGRDGLMKTSRTGKQLCEQYQEGKCSGGREGCCPKNPSHRHQCAKCLMPGHGAAACTNDNAVYPSQLAWSEQWSAGQKVAHTGHKWHADPPDQLALLDSQVEAKDEKVKQVQPQSTVEQLQCDVKRDSDFIMDMDAWVRDLVTDDVFKAESCIVREADFRRHRDQSEA